MSSAAVPSEKSGPGADSPGGGLAPDEKHRAGVDAALDVLAAQTEETALRRAGEESAAADTGEAQSPPADAAMNALEALDAVDSKVTELLENAEGRAGDLLPEEPSGTTEATQSVPVPEPQLEPETSAQSPNADQVAADQVAADQVAHDQRDTESGPPHLADIQDPEVQGAALRPIAPGPSSAAEAMMSSSAQRMEAQERAALAQAVSGEAVAGGRSFPGLIPLLLGALAILPRALFGICAAISAPLLSKPAAVRHSVGWVAANTVFLASCFWVWMVFFRPPAPTEAVNAGAAGAGVYDFEKGGLPPVPVQAKEKLKAHGDDAHGKDAAKDDHGKQASDKKAETKKPEAKKTETKKADDKGKQAKATKPAAGGH